MPLDAQGDVQSAIDRLLEDESLTEDLDDSPAQVLLNWGVEQLKQGHEGTGIRRLVRRLSGLVRDRNRLTVEEALLRLESAVGQSGPGPMAIEAELVTLWQERETLPGEEWTDQLTQLAGKVLRTLTDSAALPVETLSDGAEGSASASSRHPPIGPGSLHAADTSPDPLPSTGATPSARWWQFWRRRS
jgi:hypothetical protein